jgi:plasmid replication initiation protein
MRQRARRHGAPRGVNDVPRKLHLMPYDLLRAIGRQPTGRAYELLGQALDRLVSTTIKTNIRAENRREARSAGSMAGRSWSTRRPSARVA